MGGLSSWKYVDPAEDAYRDWVHKHFNWATPGNMLKWRQFDWHSSGDSVPRILQTLNGLKSHNIKVRAHNMVWSVSDFIPLSILALSGDALRNAVQQHITYACNLTRGLVEHWDVNNENLHGQWFQEKLQDIDYDLELFRMVHAADPDAKLFLNDYNVVAQGAATDAFLAQGLKFKAANVSLYGMGVQVHFLKGQEPSPTLVKERLDTLAQVGVPLWVTELSAEDDDPNREADFFERGLRALYGHPAVEGIVFWEFEGYKEAADGTKQLTPSAVRVLDLLEKQWMTNDTRPLAAASQYTVRGFHGDYELRVVYKGQELTNLRQTFTLGTDAKSVSVNVQA
ncbi:uncharacterized protein LOC112568938 [Pomacea canaliculata]|uniref:uncharacterized protein LOC112568938 n=1 Tax=Pomacea canaliculata TaxID=400727 RepID=UPI000D72788A|nr:uncharacterized protein LOC112568938 [Pomacea canaliculata]